MQVLAPLLGAERAVHWAVRYGVPLIRVRIGSRNWEHPFRWNDG